jgi:sulfite exporter TauE/SafE
VVARRRPEPVRADRHATHLAYGRSSLDDVLPVAGFLTGKFVSHVILGAALGLLGGAVELGFRTRALLQVAAGVVMVVLAADLVGIRAVRRVVPRPPAAWGRLVRRSGRFGGALAPALLGLATVLIPCGVTLSMEFLALASGSPLSGAAVMAAFVLGTTPLFAGLGYAARRSTAALRGRLAFLAGTAVLVAGLVSINSGLTLRGSSFTVSSVWRSLRGGNQTPAAAATAVIDGNGTQRITITVRPKGYSPSRLSARPGVPTELVLHSDRATDCTSAIVFPSLGIERMLPVDGDTVIPVGTLRSGRHPFTCAMGMYSGSIEVAQ